MSMLHSSASNTRRIVSTLAVVKLVQRGNASIDVLDAIVKPRGSGEEVSPTIVKVA